MGGVSKAQLREKLARQLKTKEECITIYGLQAKFGGGRSSGFALIYDNIDLLKKYDSKKQMIKVSFDVDGDCQEKRVCSLLPMLIITN